MCNLFIVNDTLWGKGIVTSGRLFDETYETPKHKKVCVRARARAGECVSEFHTIINLTNRPYSYF